MNPFTMNLLQLAAEEPSLTVLENAAEPVGSALEGWMVFLLIIAMVIVPFLLGGFFARMLKMKAYGTKIGLVLFTLALGLTPFVTRIINGENPLSAIRLGIDLAGGTNMVFQVDKAAAEASGKEVTSDLMDKMVAAVSRRVNPTGTEEVTVRKVGNDRIEVIVPGADQERVEQTKRQIVDLGKLEFSILANEAEHQHLIDLANRAGPDADEIREGGRLVAKWRPSAKDANGELKARPGEGVHTRVRTVGDQEILEFLVVVNPDESQRITGELLRGVRETFTEKGLAVSFTFNDRGGYLMNQLTSLYQPRPGAGNRFRLAVLLNEEVHSAPTINAVIGASGVIEGNFTPEEVEELISVLNAGALQAPLVRQPVSEFTVSPMLGVDVQRKGLTSMVISLSCVFLFMLIYYLQAGLVANICLVINLILVLGTMSLIDATFTLPGLAGLVLTIGMAVDANVLIFERMREERNKGSSLRLTIKNGFEKAFSTIFDSNVTTLITAVILYYVGTDQVKGFAVTLFIGILLSMFTAVFVGRLIFEIAEQKRWITDLKMFSLVRSSHFDFLGKKYLAIGTSLLFIVGGLVAVGLRGQDNLDIDFRGGSMVTFKFDGDIPSADEVRQALAGNFESNLSLERLVVPREGQEEILYRMRTIEPDARLVSEGIREAFADTNWKLVQQHITIGEVTPIRAADDAVGAAPDPFAGGHEVLVTLSEAMQPSSLAQEAQFLLRQSLEYEGSDTLTAASMADESTDDATGIRLQIVSRVSAESIEKMLKLLEKDLEGRPHFEEINTFDTSVAGDTKMAALKAMALSLLAIVAYLWLRFQRITYGVAACCALIHDVLVVLGMLAFGSYLSGNSIGDLLMLEDFKINLTIVAAFLTIIGYSLNDTIVIFDRIREIRGRNPALTEQIVNQSLNQTLSRTLMTSLTTLLVVAILYFMGGEGIHGFAFCLFLGIIVGTYSSIFIASPVLMWLTNRKQDRVAAT